MFASEDIFWLLLMQD